MFQSNRRRPLTKPVTPTHRPSTTRGNLTLLIFVVLLVLLICLSVYWSTQILQSPPAQQPEARQPELFADIIQSAESRTQSANKPVTQSNIQKINANENGDDSDLSIAVQKSMQMYLLRGEAHMDRVEHMIGFRGKRFDDAKEYASLKPRDVNHNYARDYNAQPITISAWQAQPESETKCDAVCRTCSSGECDVKGIKWSMENVDVPETKDVISGSTRLSSLVPVPYFSYWDFGFMTPVNTDKSSSRGLAAAFISNCGFPKRNQMVRDLQTHGVSVDSYGRCEHNRDEERQSGGRERTKIDLLSTHKFSLAFENSETDDYITEKFFGTLVSGSVPVYIGAPNVKFFAPDAGNAEVGGPGKPWKSHAVIYAGDFDFDAKKLAAYLLYLDGNETAYNEYIGWKYDGVSGDFKALVELTSATHTNCRQCILATDWSRYKNGNAPNDEPVAILDYSQDENGKWLYVRERGMYRFTLIRIEENTLEAVVKNVLQSIEPKPVNKWKNNEHPHYDRIGPAVYAIYHLPSKQVINSDAAIENLNDYVELEVIFV